MKLSVWLRTLAALLGLAKAKPEHIERAEQAADVSEIIEAEIEQTKNKRQ